jgi:hypothetical protein
MMATCSGMSRVSGTAWVELVAMDVGLKRGKPANIETTGEKPAPSFHCCVRVLRSNGKDGAWARKS